MTKKIFVLLIIAVMMFGVSTQAFAETKIGYVDLRKAFYEYEQTKSFETELTSLTEGRNEKRTEMIGAITKLRDEAELSSGDTRAAKDQAIDAKLTELQTYDRDTRQVLLTKKNDMFKAVVDDIAVIVKEMGNKQGYDYILDSRNIMFAKETFDLTDEVIAQLNK